MLMSESLEIAETVRVAMLERYGEEEITERFTNFDTICSATQERQDAIMALLEKDLDIMLVIGGYNSSNTNNLAEIASRKVPTYHIDNGASILDGNRIRHKPVGAREPIEEVGWLGEGKITIGVTAGASTPNNEIGVAILRILETLGLPAPEGISEAPAAPATQR
jgi:4-hydroxy-3-methylbut-2-enyl diphosphate reductase